MTNPTDNSIVDKRQLILNTAEQMLARTGFQGMSMHKLAQEAGIAAGTIYRYFQDKDDLVEAIRLHVLQQVADIVQQGVEDHMPLKERFILIWRNVSNMATTKNEVDIILNRLQYESLPVKPTCGNDIERQLFYKIDAMFNEGKAQGIFKPLDNYILASLSLDVSLSIAKKHVVGSYTITQATLDAAIEASWDAVIQH
ncbi:TetR/AcrR family transcriptional regulator [Vibrio aphrogenes]|uniref:TetR/AcrR family transcriptional regulator n=1 Tax=Vibrio aphrogenes TaxID=1891186 RepID=UPI000B354225|nr:TetR/AcrR family transcriptional regulator [Vibrio aphrogenes]